MAANPPLHRQEFPLADWRWCGHHGDAHELSLRQVRPFDIAVALLRRYGSLQKQDSRVSCRIVVTEDLVNGVVPASAAVYDYMSDLKLTHSLVNKNKPVTSSLIPFSSYYRSQSSLKGLCLPKFIATDMFCFMFKNKEVYIFEQSIKKRHGSMHGYVTACEQLRKSSQDVILQGPFNLGTSSANSRNNNLYKMLIFFCCCLFVSFCFPQALAVSDHFPVEVNLMGRQGCVWIIRWAKQPWLTVLKQAPAHAKRVLYCSIID